VSFVFAGADEGVSSASAWESFGVFVWVAFDFAGADPGVRSSFVVMSGVFGLFKGGVREASSLSVRNFCGFFGICGSLFSLGLGTSIIESVLRCGGVGVSGVVGEVGLEFVGVVSFPFVHASCLMILGEGEPVVSEALAIRSSEDRFVCEKSFGDIMVPRLDIPKPSILAAAAACCRSRLSGSVAVADGISKSSYDSVVLPFSCAPLTTKPSAFEADAGPFQSGCGNLPIMFNLPVPALAHCQMPRRGGD
jgi:hypothetical protein